MTTKTKEADVSEFNHFVVSDSHRWISDSAREEQAERAAKGRELAEVQAAAGLSLVALGVALGEITELFEAASQADEPAQSPERITADDVLKSQDDFASENNRQILQGQLKGISMVAINGEIDTAA